MSSLEGGGEKANKLWLQSVLWFVLMQRQVAAVHQPD